jgi:predicted nucleic-acid-binding protein
MISLDTNVLARFLLNDTPAQAAAAESILSGKEKCTAPVTVFLELAWVLESCGCARDEIAGAIRLIFGMDNFTIQDLDILVSALQWYENDMDFADSLHLAMSAGCSEFKTFDKALVKASKKLATIPSAKFP